jgi:hypothetical protein
MALDCLAARKGRRPIMNRDRQIERIPGTGRLFDCGASSVERLIGMNECMAAILNTIPDRRSGRAIAA